jgi:rRNA maturation RNase YbeY
MAIEINNLTTTSIDKGFLEKVAQKVLKGERQAKNELSIALIGQGRMRELNKKYRKKNRATDVLAFPENTKYPLFAQSNIQNLGEIVICLREVKKNAKRYGSTFEKELARVLIHGILHLSGQDHEKSETQAQKMREKENYYLSLV